MKITTETLDRLFELIWDGISTTFPENHDILREDASSDRGRLNLFPVQITTTQPKVAYLWQDAYIARSVVLKFGQVWEREGRFPIMVSLAYYYNNPGVADSGTLLIKCIRERLVYFTIRIGVCDDKLNFNVQVHGQDFVDLRFFDELGRIITTVTSALKKLEHIP